MARELPRLVRSQLEATITGASGPLESQIQSQLVNIVRNCQRELFRGYAGNREPQPSAPHARAELLANEPAPLNVPPNEALAGINAFFEPPILRDGNLLFTSEDLIHDSHGLCPPPGPAAFSDSAYSSQNTSFPNDIDAFGQNNTIEVLRTNTAGGDVSQLPGSEESLSATQRDHTFNEMFQTSDELDQLRVDSTMKIDVATTILQDRSAICKDRLLRHLGP